MQRAKSRSFSLGSSGCLAVLALAMAGTACTPRGGTGAKTPTAVAAVKPLAVSEQSFAKETAQLLLNRDRTPERTNRLVGVVRHQLGRAFELFEAGHDAAGLDAVEGALYLVRAGEFHPSMLEGRTGALRYAATVVARQGTEGRARALYSLLEHALPDGPDRAEVTQHLAAIAQWEEKTRSKGPLQATGGDERNAVGRALWEPTPDTVRSAKAAAVEWMDRAINYSKEQMPPSDDFERDEAIEAYRAIRTGAMELAALYLRNGDPAGALEAMENPRVARVVSPRLHEALRKAAEESDVESWLELFSTFHRLGSNDGDITLDADLAKGAAWGAAVELYRTEPTTMRGVMPISTLLMRNGMSEITPILIAPIVQKIPQTDVESWATGYVLEALMNHDSVGDLRAARRTFEQAAPMLAFIEQQHGAADVTPSVARVRFAMGALEARSGELSAARPLVESAVKVEPSISGYELLAAIDRQQGNPQGALKSLDAVIRLATEASDPASVADSELSAFEIYRDLGDPASAGKALEIALHRSLDARQLARTLPDQAVAERILARVLEQYGVLDGARRATSRAYEASKSDLRQLTATVLEAARRGLITNDLRASRERRAARHRRERCSRRSRLRRALAEAPRAPPRFPERRLGRGSVRAHRRRRWVGVAPPRLGYWAAQRRAAPRRRQDSRRANGGKLLHGNGRLRRQRRTRRRAHRSHRQKRQRPASRSRHRARSVTRQEARGSQIADGRRDPVEALPAPRSLIRNCDAAEHRTRFDRSRERPWRRGVLFVGGLGPPRLASLGSVNRLEQSVRADIVRQLTMSTPRRLPYLLPRSFPARCSPSCETASFSTIFSISARSDGSAY